RPRKLAQGERGRAQAGEDRGRDGLHAGDLLAVPTHRLGARTRSIRLRPGLERVSQGQVAVIDESNDPARTSWCESAQGSDFPIQNLPLGIFSVGERLRRPGVALGDYVLG